MPKLTGYFHAYVGHGHNAGAETTVHDALRSLVVAGWDVQVILGSKPVQAEPYEVDGVQVIPLKDATEVRQAPFKYFPGSDLIATHLECSQRAGLVGKRKMKIPVVHFVHNDHAYTKNMVGTLTDFAVYNTSWIDKKFDFNELPGCILHPIVEPSRYKAVRNRWSNKITLVNLFKPKGPELFYELARRNPDLEFLAVKGGYGEQVLPPSDLRNVTLVEHSMDPVKDIYQKSKVILMPSDYESYGRIHVEAAASSIPSIVSDTPGLLEANVSQHFIDPKDVDAWDRALHTVLADYKAHSEKAKSRSEELWERSQRELEGFVTCMSMLANGN